MAVVLGGAAGIGRGIALSFADAGAEVIDSCRRLELIDSVAPDIEARGRNTLRVSSNVCDRVTLEDLLQKTLDLFGKVDALVNCAAKIARADTLSFSEYRRTRLAGFLCEASERKTSNG